jgi:hypothetical protein
MVLRDVSTNTMYKRVADKVHPVDNVPSDGSVPKGTINWRKERFDQMVSKMDMSEKYADWLTPKFSDIKEGSRLHSDRVDAIKEQLGELRQQEVDVFLEMLRKREAALAWDFTEKGMLHESVAPPQVINTIPHKAWQSKAFPLPRGMEEPVIKLLRTRLEAGVLEEGHGPYRNYWFLVVKKDGGLRLINSATKVNAITIRDALSPPATDRFSEKFGMCKMLSLLDFFSGYDQVVLDEKSRDLTGFLTPIGLLRMCTLPQGATNSVAQFIRVISRILYELIPTVCEPFLDDICVHGPKETYDQEEVPGLPGVRRYVLEHIINLDRVLVNVELAGGTIAGKKSQWCQASTVIVGYLCGTDGRRPEEAKVLKIKEWGPCSSVSEVRGFLGTSGYYRQWILHYAVVAKPLTDLLRKGAVFSWGGLEQEAMDRLKTALTTAPILVTLDTGPNAGAIILVTDASILGWGAILMQEVDGGRKPIRFESGLWTPAEQNYDATKRECKGMLHAIRRLRSYVFGLHFILETDAKVLVDQLNGSVNDVPGAHVTRWLGYIMLFDFTVRHIPGKDMVADGLSRKPEGPSDRLIEALEKDVEDFIDAELFYSNPNTVEASYDMKMTEIVSWLTTQRRPEHMDARQFRVFKIKAMKYMVQDGILFLKPTKMNPHAARVICNEDERRSIVMRVHIDLGHRGVEVQWQWMRSRYHWKKMWNDIKDAKASCPQCQEMEDKRVTDLAKWTEPRGPWMKVHFDSQYMPTSKGMKFLVEARDDLTGWPEAEPTKSIKSGVLSKFLKRLIARYGVILEAVVDGGPEFRKEFEAAANEVGVGIRTIAPYNPKANGVVEGGHHTIAKFLSKDPELKKEWLDRYESALLAERMAVRSSHGYSAFKLMYGWEPLLPLEVSVPVWRVIDWDTVTDRDTLLLARIRVIRRLQQDIQEAQARVAEYRQNLAAKRNAANIYRLRPKPLKKDDLVLVWDPIREHDMSRKAKLQARWDGPYRVATVPHEASSSYTLKTLDNLLINRKYNGDRLKLFIKSEKGFWMNPEDPLFFDEETGLLKANVEPTWKLEVAHRGNEEGATRLQLPFDQMITEDVMTQDSPLRSPEPASQPDQGIAEQGRQERPSTPIEFQPPRPSTHTSDQEVSDESSSEDSETDTQWHTRLRPRPPQRDHYHNPQHRHEPDRQMVIQPPGLTEDQRQQYQSL